MQLSVIIVNYRSANLVIQCIESFVNDGYNPLFHEIIVVDNDDNDTSKALIISKCPYVKYISMGYNAGFARANNEGIRNSNAEVVLLLNSDTIAENGAIFRSLHDLVVSDDVACGVQLLNQDRTPQIAGNYAMKGGLNYLLPLPYIGAALKRISGLMKMKKPNVPDAKDRVEVDWINGAYLMVKRNAIDKAGLLDEEFFLYAEEAEWCSRIRKFGKLAIYGKYNVVHLQGETSKEAFASTGQGYFNLFDKRGLQIIVSNFLRIRKEFGLAWYLFDLLCYLIAVPVFWIATLLLHVFPVKERMYRLPQCAGFTKNVYRLLLLSPKMILRRPYFYKML